MVRILPIYFAIFAVGSLIGVSECYKLLVALPFPAKSHFSTNIALAEELARRGHDVTVISPFPRPKPNYREILIDEKIFQTQPMTRETLSGMRKSPRIVFAIFIWQFMQETLNTALSSKAMQDLIHSNDSYDAILAEFSFFQPSLTVLGHRFGAPIIDISSTSAFTFTTAYTGNPHPFSYVPDIILPLSDRMTFVERLYNSFFGVVQITSSYLYAVPKQEALVKKYFKYPGSENMPPLRAMVENISIVLVNAHFSVNYPKPYAPNVIEIGGIHLKPSGKLPKNLQKYMDEATDGVVYISFGSVVKPEFLPEGTLEKLVDTVKKLKQRVIVKWSTPTPFEGLKNALVLDWAPQQEILAHPNIRVFVTHGGYNSLMEVTSAGVPVIGIPVFADQFRNVRYYEEKGIGLGADLDEFTSEELAEKINIISNTPSFRKKAKEISRITKDRPERPLDRAVFWTEYVIRHKGAHHLKPQSVHLPYYQYLLLDVIAFVSLVISILLFIVYKSMSKVRSFFSKNKTAPTEKKKKN